MNPFALIILIALVGELALGLVADLLNLRALGATLPEEFRGVYDGERYARSQEYTRARTRFGMVVHVFDLALLLAFWGLGGFAWLDGVARDFGLGPTPTGLVFFGALYLGQVLLHLPFKLYSTFSLEERFGFNKTSAATFWSDLAKGLLLTSILGGTLFGCLFWIFDELGPTAWRWAIVGTPILLLVLQLLVPTLILPLFNKFVPLAEGELRRGILEYAQRVGFPLRDVCIMDGSKRSSKANAFFTGIGRFKRIALFDTLVESQEPDELVGVLAHEVGHYKRGHIWRAVVLAALQATLFVWLFSRVLLSDQLPAAFGVQERSVYTSFVFFALLYTPVEVLLSMALHALSRRHEFEADAFSAQTTGSPEPLIRGLKKLSAANLSNLTPHPFYVFLHHSHPPVLLRIEALRRQGA